MNIPYACLRPLLFRLPAETAHDLALYALRRGWTGTQAQVPQSAQNGPDLTVEIAGLRFANPVGLAAGFDKNARAVPALFNLGFASVEVGTVTPKPQPGNPKPRLFRLAEARAVINRFGFNSDGMERVANTLQSHTRADYGILGVNIGANKTSKDRIADYAVAAEHLSPYADYLTINISSPNTPGLRALQAHDTLHPLLTGVQAKAQGLPVFLKIAPDLTDEDLKDIADTVKRLEVSAVIVGNTTVSRPGDLGAFGDEAGGLSGAPLADLSAKVLANMARECGPDIPLIGVGGISTVDDIITRLRLGASMIQLYSAMVFEGPGLIARLITGLQSRMADDGAVTLRDYVRQGL